MRSESTLLLATGAVGLVFGIAALATGLQGVAAVLCTLVFALAALCLFTGWRYWSDSAITRYRGRQARDERGRAVVPQPVLAQERREPHLPDRG